MGFKTQLKKGLKNERIKFEIVELIGLKNYLIALIQN